MYQIASLLPLDTPAGLKEAEREREKEKERERKRKREREREKEKEKKKEREQNFQSLFLSTLPLPLLLSSGRSAHLAILAAVADIAADEESDIIFDLSTIDTNKYSFEEIVERMERLVEEGVVGFLGMESGSLVEELHEEVWGGRSGGEREKEEE